MNDMGIGRRAWRAGALLAAIVVAACGGGTTPSGTSAPASQGTTAHSSAPVTPEATPGPTALVIVPPKVAVSEPLHELWTYEGAPASNMWAPTVDPAGHIWVAAFTANQFWVLNRDGSLVETWGEAGSGDGQIAIKGELGHVFGSIAFAPDGSFVVGDGGNYRVQRFDAKRKYVGQFGVFGTGDGQFVDVSGVAIGPNGSIYVGDDDRFVVQVFDAAGKFVRSICDRAYEPAPSVARDGTVWCLSRDRLEKWTPDGVLDRVIDLTGVITLGIGMAIAPNGHLFVASVNPDEPPETAPERLLELDANGTLLHVWPTGGEGIAIDPAGDRIYISSIDLKRVRAYALPEVQR